MEPTDITIEILKGIRDEVKQTNTRIDSMHEGLSHRIDEVSHRIVASEVRTATAISDLSFTMREMTDVLRAQHDVRPRLDRCEHDITALKLHLGLG